MGAKKIWEHQDRRQTQEIGAGAGLANINERSKIYTLGLVERKR